MKLFLQVQNANHGELHAARPEKTTDTGGARHSVPDRRLHH